MTYHLFQLIYSLHLKYNQLVKYAVAFNNNTISILVTPAKGRLHNMTPLKLPIPTLPLILLLSRRDMEGPLDFNAPAANDVVAMITTNYKLPR